MKVAMAVALLFSLPGLNPKLPPRTPVDPVVVQRARKGGRWYLAENGHAVYCRGPVRLLPQPVGGLQRVATFCQGDRPMVPLKD
ncbi:MAG TPA: hypothetical protein VFA89_02265 [Terriglobales bacterium]|nr:hypothetical protein [Terriglobales bacterium]